MHRCQYELFVTHDPRVVPLSRSVFAHNHLPCCELTPLTTAQLNLHDTPEDEKHLAVRGGMQPPIPSRRQNEDAVLCCRGESGDIDARCRWCVLNQLEAEAKVFETRLTR